MNPVGALSSGLRNLNAHWFEAISADRLRFYERAFAITFVYYMGHRMMHGREWLTEVGHHISREATNPVYPMPMPLLPEWALVPFAWILFTAGGLVIFGLWRRVALWICFACAVYVQQADLIAAFTLNKFYIVIFLILALQPRPREPGSEPERDARWQWLKPDARTTSLRMQGLLQSAWPLRVIQVTLLIQYLTAGTCKIFHGDWMRNPDFLYTHAVGLYRTEAAAWAIHNLPHWTWWVQGYAALLFEVIAPLLFIVPRLRTTGYVVGFGLHLFIAVFMKDLIFFSIQMVAFYLLFINEGLIVDLERRCQRLVRFTIQHVFLGRDVGAA